MRDLETWNADWLGAWSAGDADRLAAFYAEHCRYFDTQVPNGLDGREALHRRFAKLFELAPAMHYEPDEVWAIEGGLCSRWTCTIRAGDVSQKLRGFGLVLLEGDLIAHNEIYSHPLEAELG